MSSPSGGAATINGVLYQLVWSLLHASKLHIQSSDIGADGQTGSSAFIILEPHGGGGDLRVHTSSGRHVQQVKAISGGGAWSLQEIVVEVLPDLLLAVDITSQEDRFEFITDGHMGDWNAVRMFFESLGRRPCPADDVSHALDDLVPIPFRHVSTGAAPFWPAESYSERALFDRIAASLNNDPRVKRRVVSDGDLRQSLWFMLARFRFVGKQSPVELQSKIDRLLLEVAPSNTDVATIRRALTTAVAERAARGAAVIEKDHLFRDVGLTGTPLSRWVTIVSQSSHRLSRQLERNHYRELEDVRETVALQEWPDNKLLACISGQSGQGKSWILYRLASTLCDTHPIVFMSSTNDCHRDLEIAARDFSNILGWDNAIPLERVAARLREVNASHKGPWLVLIIDAVQSVDTARDLALQDWEGWGVALCVSGQPSVMQAFVEAAADRVSIATAADFTSQELRLYLTGGDLRSYYAIPQDVRETLRRPLLARLYRDVRTQNDWAPESEYELYNVAWEWAFSQEDARMRLAEAMVLALAVDSLDGRSLWPSQMLLQAGMSQADLAVLLRRGVLIEEGNGYFSIWHDRLLNWAAARGLLAKWISGELSRDAVAAFVSSIQKWPPSTEHRRFGYVPLDLLWQLSHTPVDSIELATSILEAIELADPWDGKWIYEEGLPALGPEIVPVVVRRILDRAQADPWADMKAPAHCLATFEPEKVQSHCLALLAGDSYAAKSVACRVLSKQPAVAALEPLWALLRDIDGNEARYQPPGTSWAYASWLHDQCRKALEACAGLDPSWLERTVMTTNAESRSLMWLAYMIPPVIGSKQARMRCRTRLLTRLDAHDLRAVCENLYQFPDGEMAGWLNGQIAAKVNSVSETAFQALTRLNPGEAAGALTLIEPERLYATRWWTVFPLLMRDPEGVHRKCNELAGSRVAPHLVADLFQGFEDELHSNVIDALLIELADRLTEAGGRFNAFDVQLWRIAERLCAANSLAALSTLEGRAGSALERLLVDFMLARTPRNDIHTDHVGSGVINLLYRIGGDGFTTIVNSWLASDHYFGKLDALRLAYKRPDNETLQHIRRIATREATSREEDVLRHMAVKALVRAQSWEHLIQSVVVCGFETDRSACYARWGDDPLDDEILTPALSKLDAQSCDPPVGAILALGIAQRDDFEHRIVTMLVDSQSGSDTEKACLLALSLLRTHEEQTAIELAKRLHVSSIDGEFVEVALFNNQHPRARTLLRADLVLHWNSRVAGFLLAAEDEYEDLLALIYERLYDQLKTGPISFLQIVQAILAEVQDRQRLVHVFRDDVLEKLRELAFDPRQVEGWIGLHPVALAALSIVEPAEAYDIALRTLSDQQETHRDEYPRVLLAIDRNRAIDDLLGLVVHEPSEVVLSAICDALRQSGGESRLKLWVSEGAPARQQVLCRVAGAIRVSRELEFFVEQSLHSPDTVVYEAATQARYGQRRTKRVGEIIEALGAELSTERQWRLLDLALAAGARVDDGVGGMGSLRNGLVHMSQPRWAYAVEVADERNKRLVEEHRRKDERSEG